MTEEQTSLFEDNAEYTAFVDKFKPKLTTDDCYTPPLVYDAIRDWACKEFDFSPDCIVRPFYPGGDYEHFDYPADCVVLDNPPFSILTKIITFYLDRGIRFFLFAPSLTALSGRGTVMRCCHIMPDADIVYENGAVVHTAFITSFNEGIIAMTSPELHDIIDKAITTLRKQTAVQMPKYIYPDNIVTASMFARYSKYGVDLKIRREDCTQVAALDSQREHKKAIYGTGLLLSERAAAERAAAERAAAHVWELSDRERGIIATLGVS